MSISRKYGRSYHFDFSPGTTSDDRINKNWRDDVSKFKNILHTEKLDGENNCLNEFGVFSRSHAAPSRHPWCNYLKEKHSMMVNDLKENNLEIFGENIYAQHSIVYPNIKEHYYVFGVRVLDKWLSWEEVKWYADFFDLPTVPELLIQPTNDVKLIESTVIDLASKESVFGSLENGTEPLVKCTREGIVSRNIEEYSVDDLSTNLMKWVRKGHVNTDEHWSKNWKRAELLWEKKKIDGKF
jgi:hypothetical protein